MRLPRLSVECSTWKDWQSVTPAHQQSELSGVSALARRVGRRGSGGGGMSRIARGRLDEEGREGGKERGVDRWKEGRERRWLVGRTEDQSGAGKRQNTKSAHRRGRRTGQDPPEGFANDGRSPVERSESLFLTCWSRGLDGTEWVSRKRREGTGNSTD